MEETLGVKRNIRDEIISKRAMVRYADDFVVFCESKEDAETIVATLTGWLAQRGLTLSPEKTRIVHLTEGFDFLGFNIRHYPNQNTTTGYKLLIKPSKQAVQNIRHRLRDEWVHCKGASVATVIKRLNPMIRGWANYFRIGVASETFQALDDWMFKRQVRYVNHTHPTKSWTWRRTRYWGNLNPKRQDHWVFGDKQTGSYLLKFRWTKIERHTLVKGAASSDDPTLRAYWHQRTAAKAKALTPRLQKLARRQGAVCPTCGEPLCNDEALQVDHLVPHWKGGTDDPTNLALKHLYCHQQKTSREERERAKTAGEHLDLYGT